MAPQESAIAEWFHEHSRAVQIAIMIVFSFSVFCLLLFLWLTFGGSVPLKPEAFRFKTAFPEAATLSNEADVRIAGVNVGKVKTKELDKRGVRTIVEMEIEDKFAPIPSDTKAILRQKTLLGETYVELTPGSARAPKLEEDALLASSQVEPAVELDEILRIFDTPTKKAFETFVDEQSKAFKSGTSEDLNDALGSLPAFTSDGSDALRILDEQKVALKQVIKNTGVVFGALNKRDGELRRLIVNGNEVFDATATEKEKLAETFEIFPTFLDESKATVERLEVFASDTRPLVNDLKPVADDLGPTVRDLGNLAPDLENLFADLEPLIEASKTGLPDAARFLNGAEPVLEATHRFLPELNPILSFANLYQATIGDFFTDAGDALGTKLRPNPGQPAPIHVLPQFGIINPRSFAFNVSRKPEYDRGNAYLPPDTFSKVGLNAAESFDCRSSDVRREAVDDGRAGDNPGERVTQPPCILARPSPYGGTQYPRVEGKIPPLVNMGELPKPPAPTVPTRTDNDRGRVR